MVNKAIYAALLLLVGGATSLAAGIGATPADANALQTLPEYLTYAALHNAGLKAAFERWKAALEEIPQARTLPDPRFTYGYFIEEVETRVGPQRQRVGISQVFPWFGKIAARTDAATADARAAQRHYEAKKLQLFYDVKDAFYEYVYLRRAIDNARENLELVKHFEELARTRYVTAEARHPDVVRAQIELATLEDKLATLEELRRPIVARLNAALNRPGGALPWPRLEEATVVEVDRPHLFKRLRDQNPQLQAKRFELESARSRVELAKKRFYPDLGVGIDWIQTDEASAAGVSDSGKDPVILMFSMNLPLWRKSYGARELQARAQARQIANEKDDIENSLVAQVERVLYDVEDSERKLKLYGDVLVPKAEELLGASET
ncbi:MAG: TolC family protein, partial [Sedimentisphaerales bacterium]|nr:TolC family protein [Sedimentisphaerales bacterium]